MDAEDLDRVVALGAEPVRQPGVELVDLARAHRDVVLAEDQPQPAREDVQPLVALVDAQLAVALGWNDDLPHLHGARLLREREDQPALPPAWSEPDPGIADLGCADELVERNLMGLGQREKQLEARLPLAALEAGERALRDPGRRREGRQRDAASPSQPSQARADLGQHVRDPGRALDDERR